MSERETKKRKGALFYALLFVCLGVWGYVFYRIAHDVEKTEDAFDVALMGSVPEPALEAAPRRPAPHPGLAARVVIRPTQSS